MVIDRINTKARLQKLGILQQNQITCCLCNKFEETSSHLFFSCQFAWYLRCHWLKEWKTSWVISAEQKSFFESWMMLPIRRQRRKAWWRAFFVTIWKRWRCRDSYIFYKKVIGKQEALNLALFWHKEWSGSK